MFNATQLIGHLGADPDSRYFESGSQVSRFTLYVNEKFNKDGQTEERTHRFPVEVWGKTAEFVNNYLRKGSRVAVQGSLAENTWTDETGNHSRVIIKANRIENLTPKKAEVPEDEF
ncbi:MAG: single-stranded DNA-binding protein [Cyanobacteria bacterium J06639_14]